MPFNYAHYRFGTAMLSAMPGDIQRTAKRYRRLFDVGLHGPDIFFYCNPLPGSKQVDMRHQFHYQSGKEFFGRVCRSLRLDPSPAAEAYLYGVLCHYALDSVLHPFVLEQEAQGIAEHFEIEVEFDRFLLELDGRIPPQQQDLSSHLRLATGEPSVVARFYPGLTGKSVERTLWNMTLATKALALRNTTGRKIMKSAAGVVNRKFQFLVMTQEPNPRCSQLNQPLLALYETAQERFPELLLQLCAHLAYNAPLDDRFTANFE